MAMLEAVAEFIEYLITKANATIICSFYTDERREDGHAKPTIQMSDSSMGIGSVWCHIILDGNYKKLSNGMLLHYCRNTTIRSKFIQKCV